MSSDAVRRRICERASMGQLAELESAVSDAQAAREPAIDDILVDALHKSISSITWGTKECALMLVTKFHANVTHASDTKRAHVLHVLASAPPPTAITRVNYPEQAAEHEAEYIAVLHAVFERLGSKLWDSLANDSTDYWGFPMHSAALHNNDFFIDELVKLQREQARAHAAGADAAAANLFIAVNTPNAAGDTPLSLAARDGCARAMDSLLKAGADVSIPSGRVGDPGTSIIMHAMTVPAYSYYRTMNHAGFYKDGTRLMQVLRLALAAGCEPNDRTRDADKDTLLHMAAKQLNAAAAEALILHGAYVHVRNGAQLYFTSEALRVRDNWMNLCTAAATAFCQRMNELLPVAVPRLAWRRRQPVLQLRSHILRPARRVVSAAAKTGSAHTATPQGTSSVSKTTTGSSARTRATPTAAAPVSRVAGAAATRATPRAAVAGRAVAGAPALGVSGVTISAAHARGGKRK